MANKVAVINCPDKTHVDNTPSCVIYDDGTYYCFGSKHTGVRWGRLDDNELKNFTTDATFSGSSGIIYNREGKLKRSKTKLAKANLRDYMMMPEYLSNEQAFPIETNLVRGYINSRSLDNWRLFDYGARVARDYHSILFPTYDITMNVTGCCVRDLKKNITIRLSNGLEYPTYSYYKYDTEYSYTVPLRYGMTKKLIWVESIVDGLSLDFIQHNTTCHAFIALLGTKWNKLPWDDASFWEVLDMYDKHIVCFDPDAAQLERKLVLKLQQHRLKASGLFLKCKPYEHEGALPI